MTMPNKPFNLFLLASALVLAFLLLGPVLIIPLHIPINYNEGWNAIFDTRAIVPGAGPLYPPPDSFVFNNYPPLGFYIVGALGRWVFADMIVAGRTVALLSLLGAAALTGLCVCYLGGARRAGVAATLFLLLNMTTYYRTYIAMDDPQWLAHAMMLAALALLLRGGVTQVMNGQKKLPAIACAALLMVAGGFVKHNLIGLPISVTLWLALYNRRAAAIWVLAALLGLCVGVGLTAALHGSVAFNDILHHRRVFRTHLWTHALKQISPLYPMAILAAVLLSYQAPRVSAAHRAAIVLVALFAPIATVTGITQRFGEGVYYNAHFETPVAVCLAFGLALSPLLKQPIVWRKHAIAPVWLALVAALPLIGAWPWHLPDAWDDIADRHAREAAWKPVIARIAAADGPAGCIFMSVCWWAGKPSQVDLFNLTQSVLAGGPFAGFQAAVTNRHFAIFEDDPASFLHLDAVRKLGHDPIMEAVNQRYGTVAHGPQGILLLAPLTR